MSMRHLLAALLLPVLASCSKPAEPAPPAPAAVVEREAATAPAPQPAAEAAAPAAAEPAAPAEPASPAPPAAAAAAPAALPAASDYQQIPNGQPFEPADGKIEVVEFFNYACPACDRFDPLLEAWKAKLPADVNFVYIPVDFRPDFVQYARAYYAAESMGLVEKTHTAVYKAIHDLHTLPGEGQPQDESRVAAFYAKYGADPKQFQQLMDSFTVNTEIARGRKFMTACQITGTPTLVIDGRYVVKGKGGEDTLRVASQLIAAARKP